MLKLLRIDERDLCTLEHALEAAIDAKPGVPFYGLSGRHHAAANRILAIVEAAREVDDA